MKIFRNIEYKPRIWGIAFTHLFIVIILTLFGYLLFGIMGKWFQVALAIAIAIGSYSSFYASERIDKIEFKSRFQWIRKKRLTPYEISSQRIILKDFKEDESTQKGSL